MSEIVAKIFWHDVRRLKVYSWGNQFEWRRMIVGKLHVIPLGARNALSSGHANPVTPVNAILSPSTSFYLPHEDGETGIIFRRTESDLYVYPRQWKRDDHLGVLFPPYLHASIIAFDETVPVFEVPPWVILLAGRRKRLEFCFINARKSVWNNRFVFFSWTSCTSSFLFFSSQRKKREEMKRC